MKKVPRGINCGRYTLRFDVCMRSETFHHCLPVVPQRHLAFVPQIKTNNQFLV